MDYLKDKQHYIDLYDLLTIRACLRIIEFGREVFKDSQNNEEFKKASEEEKQKAFNYIINSKLFVEKGERYRRKGQRILEMIEDDRKKQDFYDNTPEPSNIICNTCGKRLFSETKILEDYLDTPMRVLFFFPCKTCKKKRGIYSSGEEYESKPQLCPKCKSEIKESHVIKGKDDNKIITWKRKCTKCKFHEEEVDDFAKKRAEWKKKEDEDKELLSKYRDEFCLAEKEGEEYIETIEKMRYANEVFEEEVKKYDDQAYQQATKVNKLGIVELEKKLSELFYKENYIKLAFDKPEIGQFVMVPFTVQDADSSRKGHESTSNLEKILKPAIEGTNWRLLSNSLSYRLGYVSGQLKGYEQEEDILKLFQPKETPKKSVEDDHERRMKYGGDNMVQLARMIGQHKGIENMRKRRLEKEPKGFFLQVDEGPLNCMVCKELTPGNKIWWDLNGIKCVDCQRNIEEGVIPAEICRDDKLWIREWQFQGDYSLHGSTRRKLEKEGVLKSRILKRQDGTEYSKVYLVSENQEFLKKYPKKPAIDIKFVNTNDK